MANLRRSAVLGVLLGLLAGGVAFAWPKSDAQPQPIGPTPTPMVVKADGEQQKVNALLRAEEPTLRLAWTAPAEVRVNRAAPYTLTVANTGTQAVRKVVVQVRVPEGVTATDANPSAATVAGVLLWELGTLQPRDVRELRVNLASSVRGELMPQAWVTFTGYATTSVTVREPKLEAFISSPEIVKIGEPIPISYGVRNSGDTTADAVKIVMGRVNTTGAGFTNEFSNTLPGGNGQAIAQGKESVEKVTETAEQPGIIDYEITATGADGLKASARARVKVLAPQLQLKVEGPGEIGLTKTGYYTVTVTNTGDLAADATLSTELGAGLKQLEVAAELDNGFNVFELWGGQFILDAGKSQSFRVKASAVSPGNFANKFRVTESRGSKAHAECLTAVKGVPGIRMELVDSIDPVKVGGETTYVIKVSNTGMATDRNLSIACEFPDGLKVTSVSSPVTHREIHEPATRTFDGTPVAGRTVIRFNPVRELGPKTEVAFRVTVKTNLSGNTRVRAALTSDHLTTPVVKEESTTVYGD